MVKDMGENISVPPCDVSSINIVKQIQAIMLTTISMVVVSIILFVTIILGSQLFLSGFFTFLCETS